MEDRIRFCWSAVSTVWAYGKVSPTLTALFLSVQDGMWLKATKSSSRQISGAEIPICSPSFHIFMPFPRINIWLLRKLSTKNDGIGWNIMVNGSLHDWEIEEYENLLALLDTIQLNNTNDKLTWLLESSGSFRVKSFYNHLVGHNSVEKKVFPAKMIWRANAPTKVSFFAWEASKECILTIDKIMKKGFTLTNRCFLRKNNAESSNHFLLWCPITHKLWSMV